MGCEVNTDRHEPHRCGRSPTWEVHPTRGEYYQACEDHAREAYGDDAFVEGEPCGECGYLVLRGQACPDCAVTR